MKFLKKNYININAAFVGLIIASIFLEREMNINLYLASIALLLIIIGMNLTVFRSEIIRYRKGRSVKINKFLFINLHASFMVVIIIIGFFDKFDFRNCLLSFLLLGYAFSLLFIKRIHDRFLKRNP